MGDTHESGFSITTEIYDTNGQKSLVTFRAVNAGEWRDAMKARGEFFEVAHSRGWGERQQQATVSPNESKPAAPSGQQSGDFREMTATLLVVTANEKDGSPSYKAKGQPWSEFGVKVWPETIEGAKIDATQFKFGPNPINWKCSVLMVDGKPKKVTRIEAQ